MNSLIEKGKNRDQKIDKFLDVLGWYFSEKIEHSGFYATIGRIEEKIGKLNENAESLNKNIENASISSGNLTQALNRITLSGVIVAGIGILLAVINLSFEIYKYFN